jgi:hypothetical protein
MLLSQTFQPFILKAVMGYKKSPTGTIITANAVIAALWSISLLLAHLRIPYFTTLLGIFVLLAPGFCLALLIEQLSKTRAKIIIFIISTVLFSFVLSPTAVWALSTYLLKQSPVNHVVEPFLIWWIICFTITVIVSLINRQSTVLTHSDLNSTEKRELGIILGAFCIIAIINFIVYPLLPEGDGYAVLINWHAIQLNPSLLASETRIPFLIFINICADLLKISPYWVLKALLPLSCVTILLSCYLFTQKFIPDSRYRILLSLSPLFFPIILQELLIGRPQSLFLIAFLPSVVISSDILAEKKNIHQVYWLLVLCIIGIIGIKIHTLFALIALIGIISIFLFFLPQIIAYPFDSAAIILGLLVLVLPTIAKTRLVPDLLRLIQLFSTMFHLGNFDFWFIDHYRNVDGAEVGWPGLSSLFYYGYNLGLFFPIILIMFAITKRGAGLKKLLNERYWAVLFTLFFFLFIAEIAPRFQLAYLPDRAWLFLSLMLLLLLPLMVKELTKETRRSLLLFISFIGFLSLVAGTVLTYAKQGWVTTNEVAAAPFIKTNTPDNAVFLAQGGTRMMIRYYTQRIGIHSPATIFLTGEKSALADYLKEEEELYLQSLATISQRRANVSTKLAGISQEIKQPNLTDVQLKANLESLNTIYEQKNDYFANNADLNERYPTIGKPIYLIYNQNKFDSLYGKRNWWRTSNFYGAKIERLNQNYPVVYNKNGVTIWEARK